MISSFALVAGRAARCRYLTGGEEEPAVYLHVLLAVVTPSTGAGGEVAHQCLSCTKVNATR